MNNGYNGTGISIIFYLVLAFLMPIIQLTRILLHRSNYGYKFVWQHFVYALTIAVTVAVVISFLMNIFGINDRTHWHTALHISAALTIGLLIMWVVIPLLINLVMFVFHKKHTKPRIQPLPKPQAVRRLSPPRRSYRFIDGIISKDTWRKFQEYNSKGKLATK
jgi:chromate transport protein ChrA